MFFSHDSKKVLAQDSITRFIVSWQFASLVPMVKTLKAIQNAKAMYDGLRQQAKKRSKYAYAQ